MSVKRRKDGKWLVYVSVMIDGKRERFREAAPTRETGMARERALRAELAAGIVAIAKPPIFREWSSEFLEVYATNNNKFSERRNKRQIVEQHLDPFFGSSRIDRIDYAQIERFKALELAAGAAPKSVNNRLGVLRRLLVIAHKNRKLTTVPEIQWLKVPEPSFCFLRFEEASRLVDASAEWRPMILLALRTGLRHGELLALRWEDVDLVAGRLMVRRAVWRGVEGTPKGGREREVPLSDEAREALRALPSRFRSSYVFGAGDVRLTAGETKWPLWSSCRRAGIVRCGWHVLRHTFASHLAMKGVAIKAIQDLLGHTSMKMTLRYAHLSPTVGRDAVALLDETGRPRLGLERTAIQ